MNTPYRFDSSNLRRALGVAGAVTLASCALLAVVGLLPAAQPRLALAQGVGAGSVTHTLVSDFQVCTVLTGTINRVLTDTIVSGVNGGEIRLAALLEDYFDGTQVDATKWLTSSTDAGAQRPIVGNGMITLNNTLARSLVTVPAQGRYAEIRARFAISVGNGDIGFGRLNQPGAPPPPVLCPGGTDCDGSNRLFISLGGSNAVYANGRDGYEPSGGPINTLQAGLTFTEFHRYRIEWNLIDTLYYVDGVLDPAATFTSAASITYTPYVWLYTDHFDPPRPLEVDWIRVLYYPAGTGQYQSCAIDSAQQSSWTTLTFASDLPAGTSATFETRSSGDGVTWNAWAAAGASGSIIPSPNGRYLQYRVTLSTTDVNASPEIGSVAVAYELNQPPTADAGGLYAAAEGTGVSLDGSGSSDPNGDTLIYEWDLNYTGAFDVDASGVSPVVTFPDGPATTTIALRVRDESGLVDVQTATVTVANVAPSVSTTGPYAGGEGSSIAFTGIYTDPGSGDTHVFLWSFGDGVTSTLQSPSHTYADDGLYTAVFTATDDDGGFNAASTTVAVANVSPTANFAAGSPVGEGSPSSLSLTGPADPGALDTVAGFRYAFACPGDALPSTYAAAGAGASSDCTFSDNGAFDVRGRVFDKDDGFTTYTATVTVANVAPSVSTTGPYSGNEGSPIAFTGVYTDPGSGDTHAFLWSFGDGLTSTLRSPSHAFADDGLYTAVFTATDDDGGFNFASTPVTVANVAPSISITTTGSVFEGSPATVVATVTDPGILDTFTYWYDCTDDGVYENGPTSSGTALCLYLDDTGGPFSVRVRVDDDDGGSANTAGSINVINVTPIAGAENNGPVDEGSPVTITADQTDPGASDTFEYRFDCGDDGVYEIDWQPGATAECSFGDDDGSPFDVRVQVRDDDGGQSSPVTTSASVNNVAPIASTTGPYTGAIERVIAFTGVFSDAGSGDTHTFLWDFGDGFTSTLQSPGHAYTAVGDYTVVFTVTDDDGGVGVATTTATVRHITFLPLITRSASGGGASQAAPDSTANSIGQPARFDDSAWTAWIIAEKVGIHTSQQRREDR